MNHWNARRAHAMAALAIGTLCACAAAGATPVCRWVDSAGRTQVASTVPEPYRAQATCTDSQRYELSPAQQRAAALLAEEDEDRARLEAATRPAPSAHIPSPPDPAPSPSLKRPVEIVTESTSCQTWWRLYDESGACFGPYRTARGGTKAEAFDMCNVVLSPESRCGPRSD